MMSNAQTMDEKALDVSIEDLINRTRELKSALEQFLMKIEREHASLTWPSVLDSFALLSGQMSSLFNLLQSEKVSPLQNYPVIPLRLGQDNDQFLQGLTEGRLHSLNHSVVPDYLRTKAIPDVEQTEKQMIQEGNAMSDATVKNFNKLCDRMLEKLKNPLPSRNEAQFRNTKPTHNINETYQLIAAASYGTASLGKETKSVSQQSQLPPGAKMQQNANIKLQQSNPYSR